jgi:hypothetical protein
VVFFGGGQPHPVVSGLAALVAQYEDNLVLNGGSRTSSGSWATAPLPRRARTHAGQSCVAWWRRGCLPAGERAYCDGVSTSDLGYPDSMSRDDPVQREPVQKGRPVVWDRGSLVERAVPPYLSATWAKCTRRAAICRVQPQAAAKTYGAVTRRRLGRVGGAFWTWTGQGRRPPRRPADHPGELRGEAGPLGS